MKRQMLLAAAALALVTNAQAQPHDQAHAMAHAILAANPNLPYDPASVLVRFDPRLTAQERAAARPAAVTRVREVFKGVPGLELVEVNVPVAQAIASLRAARGVIYAEPNYVMRASTTPNDPSFGVLWGLHNTGQTVNGDPGTANADLNAPEAWDISTGDPNFVIADIDTGVNMTHPDLAANIWTNPGEIAGNGIDDDANGYIDDTRGWNFVAANNNPQDDNGHGTHTSGTFGAVGNNGVGIAGVAWQCKIVPLKFLNASGSGYTSDAVKAVQYCTAKGIKVSNNSWGGGGFSQALYDAINAAKSVGHVFVASAGNSNVNADVSPSYPGAYTLDNIISVAATTNDDTRASFSNYGAVSVDLGAPGVNIYSCYGSGYAYLNGTSMAAPHVTGVVALVYAQNPSWTYSQVRSRILSTVRPVPAMAGITVTGGIVNAAAALAGSGPVNTAPSVSISSPANGSSFVSGSFITFTGSSLDTQDGDLSAGIVWTSNLMGQIGTGASFSRTDLVIGTHTITASSMDSGSLTGAASVQVIITSGVTIPAAPSGGTASSPSTGTARVVWTDNSGNETTFDIERQQRIGNRWGSVVSAGSVGANVTSFTQSIAAGKYRFRVRATNSAGSSAWSAWSNQVTVR